MAWTYDDDRCGRGEELGRWNGETQIVRDVSMWILYVGNQYFPKVIFLDFPCFVVFTQ